MSKSSSLSGWIALSASMLFGASAFAQSTTTCGVNMFGQVECRTQQDFPPVQLYQPTGAMPEPNTTAVLDPGAYSLPSPTAGMPSAGANGMFGLSFPKIETAAEANRASAQSVMQANQIAYQRQQMRMQLEAIKIQCLKIGRKWNGNTCN